MTQNSIERLASPAKHSAVQTACCPGSRLWLAIILLISAALRIQLAYQGGQYYWPDEQRYGIARDAVHAAYAGNWAEVKQRMLGTSDHLFFRYISIVPALFDKWFIAAEAPSPPFAAAILSLFGVAGILMVWLIMRDALGNEAAATWGAFFYACSTVMFFLSRHYFSYDAAVCLMLTGWWVGRRGEGLWRHWLTGCLVGLGYLTYNAYWNFGGVILAFHVMRAPWELRMLLRRGLTSLLGLLTPIILLLSAAYAAGYNLIEHAINFSHTVTQGGFGRGWWLILSYYAVAERGYMVLLLALMAVATASALRHRHQPSGAIWLFMGLLLAAEMVLLSDVVERFALSGRMVRPLMVFIAMGAGALTAQWLAGRPRPLKAGIVGLAIILAGVNFSVPLQLRFPTEFRQEALAMGAKELMGNPGAVLQLYYADFMHRPKFIAEFPPHVELLRRMHPVQYRPYQFEGYDESMREAFEGNDFAMRLVKVTELPSWQQQPAYVGADIDPYAGAIEIVLHLPSVRPIGKAEPLVVGGVSGRADIIALCYLDAEQVQVMVDHWGWGAVRSAPFKVAADDTTPQTVIISAGTLLPPPGQSDTELAMLAERVVVTWNGRVVMQEKMPFYTVPKSQVTVGANFIGGTTTETTFSGKIASVHRIDPRLMVNDKDVGGLIRDEGGWGRSVGPLDVFFEWDEEPGGPPLDNIPILTVHRGGFTVSLTGRWDGQRLVFDLRRQDDLVATSRPVPMSKGAHQLQLWVPLLMPKVEEVGQDESSLVTWARRNFVLKLDGQTVLSDELLIPDESAADAPTLPQRTYFLVGRESPLENRSERARFPGLITRLSPVRRDGPVLLRAMWQDKMESSSGSDVQLGPLRLKVRFPKGREGRSEPLLSSGRTGVADTIFVRYLDGGRIQVGHDHWGWALLESAPIAVDLDAEHVVDISMGSLYPPEASLWAERLADSISRNGRLFVAINGTPVLAANRETYRSSAANVAVGRSFTGASTASTEFGGEILQLRILDPAHELPEQAQLSSPQ